MTRASCQSLWPVWEPATAVQSFTYWTMVRGGMSRRSQPLHGHLLVVLLYGDDATRGGRWDNWFWTGCWFDVAPCMLILLPHCEQHYLQNTRGTFIPYRNGELWLMNLIKFVCLEKAGCGRIVKNVKSKTDFFLASVFSPSFTKNRSPWQVQNAWEVDYNHSKLPCFTATSIWKAKCLKKIGEGCIHHRGW